LFALAHVPFILRTGNRRKFMNILLAVFAGIAAIVGLLLLWWRSRVARELKVITSVEVTGAGAVAALPPGQVVEVAGTLRVRTPLTAEFSQKPCAYFKAEIEREEVYYERDSQGREERRTRTTTVYTNMKYGQCLIEDASGRVGIDFDGADVEAIQTVNEPTAAPGQGNTSGIIGGVLSALANTNSTYTRKESILPADIPVFVLGEVREGGLIGKPAKGSKNKIFVISHKSKEERTTSLTKRARWLLIFIVLFLGTAAALLVWSVAKGEEKKTSNLILRSAQSARLEGWRQAPSERPSFEARFARTSG
jgi:flagellar basal body-associated protein FliL